MVKISQKVCIHGDKLPVTVHTEAELLRDRSLAGCLHGSIVNKRSHVEPAIAGCRVIASLAQSYKAGCRVLRVKMWLGYLYSWK